MTIEELYNSFKNANVSFLGSNKFNVKSIDGMLHKIGKSENGFPIVFAATKSTVSGIGNLNGEIISVEYNVSCCLIDDNNHQSDENYSIITLRTEDTYLCRIFIEVFFMSLATLPQTPTDKELALKVEGLLSIFAALKKAPIHKIQGLWAELLVIDTSKEPEELAKAWHSSPNSKFDFTKGANKIEVKSTSSENRVHKFSLDQLNPTESTNLYIASVIVRESAPDSNGLSVDDLYKKICTKVMDVNIRMHIYQVITETLGSDYQKAATVYFDYVAGKDSVQFYDSKDIPKINKKDVPPFVTGVKFDSDLTHLDPVERIM